MGYPNQPQYPNQQPQQGYPNQQPQQGYQPPQYHPAQMQPQQGYPQQPGYAPAQPQAPAAPVQRGSLSDFYDQPAMGGKSIAGWFTQFGQSLTGIVARPITNADIQVQTDMNTGLPAKPYADGRQKLTMSIPLIVNPQQYPAFPDGRAAWIVGAGDRGELDRAMREAGVPEDQIKAGPEAGAQMTITYTNNKQVGNFTKKVKAVTYTRPQGAGLPANGQQQGQQQSQPPWTPQMAEQAGNAAVQQAGGPLAQAMFPPQQGPPPAPQPYQPQGQQADPGWAGQGYAQPQSGQVPPTSSAPTAGMPGAQPANPGTVNQQQAGPAPLPAENQALLAKLLPQAGQQPQG